MLDEELEGNSNASKKVQSKQVTSNVIVKKESEGSKLKKKFFAEDAKTVGGHVVDTVVIPSIKKIISDIVKTSVDYFLYGSKGARPTSGPGIISYNQYYNRGTTIGGGTPITYGGSPLNGGRPNTLYSVNEVIFPERDDAEKVLLNLKESIVSFGMVSVADFYEMINQRSVFTDQKWGWRDLSQADVIRVDNGFQIRFPRLVALEP